MTMLQKKINVLYVDDEVGNLTAFKATFRRDFNVHTSASADEGMALLAQHPMHVVISDQRMPGTTGSQFLAMVKDQYPRTIRMLLTGYSDIEAVVEAINKGGIYCYCTKPWDPNDLKLRIEQAYEVHHLREQREQLLQRYRQVFETSGDPVFIMDADGKFLDGNPATLHLFAVSAEALRGLALPQLLDKPEIFQEAMDSLIDGRPFVNADLSLRSPSGAMIDCLFTITALGPGPDGRPLAQAMIKDITDRKQEEQRLRKLNDDLDKRVNVRTRQLLDALEDLGSFNYTVAHDLRSPLKNILAMSEHLRELVGTTDELQAETAERIQRGTSRLLQLIDDLLRFAQASNRELRREEILVKDLFDRCINDHVPEELRASIRIEVDPSSVLRADPAMLNVVLGNLLGNAIKYSRSRDNRAIVLGHRALPGVDRIWVGDNGVGFDGSKGDLVFGAFKRMHRSDQFEGTGVGLAIVQRIVAKHNGAVRADSAPDQGTTITIDLPMDEAGSAPLAQAS